MEREMKRAAIILVFLAPAMTGAGADCEQNGRTDSGSATERSLGPPTFEGRSVYTQRPKQPCSLYTCGRDHLPSAQGNSGGHPSDNGQP
jgi:hypothetical protein